MKKKLVTLLCVTTLTASMLAGCGSKAETPAVDTTTTEETQTLLRRLQTTRTQIRLRLTMWQL